VSYGPTDPSFARVVPETCITSDQASSLAAAGTQLVLIDQPAQKDSGCGKTQAAQVSAMNANLAGAGLGWNYGPGAQTLQTASGQVVPFPATNWVDFSGPAFGPKPGIASLLDVELGSCIMPAGFHSLGLNLTPNLATAMANGPSLVRIHLSRGGNCMTTKVLDAEFWYSVVSGAGVSWSMDDYDPGHTFDPNPALVTEAGRLANELADVQQAVLLGKPLRLKQPKNPAVPVWTKDSGKWSVGFQKTDTPVRSLWAWKYNNQVYVLAVGQGTYGGRIATHWKTHINGKWVDHKWNWPRIPVKLKGIKRYRATGLFGAKGLKIKHGKASIGLGALGAKWFVLRRK
jgi:hypothetical protein